MRERRSRAWRSAGESDGPGRIRAVARRGVWRRGSDRRAARGSSPCEPVVGGGEIAHGSFREHDVNAAALPSRRRPEFPSGDAAGAAPYLVGVMAAWLIAAIERLPPRVRRVALPRRRCCSLAARHVADPRSRPGGTARGRRRPCMPRAAAPHVRCSRRARAGVAIEPHRAADGSPVGSSCRICSSPTGGRARGR